MGGWFRWLGGVGLAMVLASGSAVVAAEPSPGTVGAATPGEACRGFFEAIADTDVDRMLSLSSVGPISERYRFDLIVDRVGSFFPGLLAPTTHPMYRRIDRMLLEGRLMGQVLNLTYALLSGETIDGTPLAGKDLAWAQGFTARVDPARLSSLTVVDVRQSEPGIASSTRHLENRARVAASMGADEQDEQLALFHFDNGLYLGGCMLLRFGEAWTVQQLGANLGALDPLGVPEPTTTDEFDRRTGR